MKLAITCADGKKVTVDAHKFTVYVDNIAYQFAYHEAHDRINELVVSEIKTGMRVCVVGVTTRMAACGNDKLAAKMTVESLVARLGGERVRRVIDSAIAAAK